MKKTLKNIISAAFGIFFLWLLFSGGADDALENVRDNVDGKNIVKDVDNKKDDECSVLFTKYKLLTTDDSFKDIEVEVPVPGYTSKYVMDGLTEKEKENLLYSIYLYSGTKTINDLMDLAHPVQIPSETVNFREMVREPFSIGMAYIFDIRVDFISELDSFKGTIQGESSAPITVVDAGFTGGNRKLMANDVINTIAVFAGLKKGTPVFIALNMEIQ